MFKLLQKHLITVLLFVFVLSVSDFGQILVHQGSSNGPVPMTLKNGKSPDFTGVGNTEATIGYGYASIALTSMSLPMPAGTPITPLTAYTFPNSTFASSMTRGGDGNYYITSIEPALYQMDPTTGVITLIGSITGMGADQVNGFKYNPANDSYYIVSSNNFFSFDLSSRVATLIGPLNNSGGLMIDLCFDAAGTCYAYDLGLDNAYTINVATGNATLLGSLGYDANYGQGMAYDFETNTIYLSAFNNSTVTGQLRTMDPATGSTTLVVDWGFEQIAPFALETQAGPPCPVGQPSNPSPAAGTVDVPINPGNATWTNGSGATTIEVYFGEFPNLSLVYSGAPITTLAIPGPLDYFTTYGWRVDGANDTCGVNGPTWTFRTVQDPFYTETTDTLYPSNAAYWTGTTDGTTKSDGEVRGQNTEDGWFTFDVSSLPDNSTILDVTFEGYVNSTTWPYWSLTPLPGLNPLTATASDLKTAIEGNSGQSVAYVYSNETSAFTAGWHSYPVTGTVNEDLAAALPQGWFAMGMDSRDNSASYWINWDGWSQTNVPYIIVHYGYAVPVELTSFAANVNDNDVTLNWSTATETNNSGFQVERNNGSGYEVIGFVAGHGTTTEIQSYSFVDKNIGSGNYSYRLKQIDYNGTYSYSNTVEAEIVVKEYSLSQNYPNPFNPSTIIRFSLMADSKVSLKIFDVLGQEVATLINGQMSAGSQTVNFDASHMNSGVYFYRLDADGVDGQKFSSTKKMILTK